MNGFGKRLNESFNNYFKKLNESKFEEFENMEKEPMFTFPNGEYLYVNVDKDKDTIYAGGATNNGIFREFEIDYDFDDTLDGNLNRLYDTIIEERPELMDEEPMDESLEDLKDYPGAKKIDTIKGIAIDTDRVQSGEAEDKYGFYQGDIIFGDEHLEVGEEYAIDVYEIPEEDWDEEGTGFGIGKDNPYFMVLKNKIDESLKESLGASSLVRDLYSKFKEIEFIDERDLGENVGLIYDISKLKDKDTFKEYVKEYKVKRSVNNPNRVMIIAKEDIGEDIDESYNRLNEKLPHKMVSTLSPKDTGKDYENGIGHEISPKYVKHLKEVDRKRLADVYVLVSYEGDEITIPYLEYNKRVYGEPLQYFIAEIPDYDVTNPEEAQRRGYNRNKSFGYRLEKDDIRDDKSKLDSRRSEQGHHFTTEHGKKMNQLNRDLTLRSIDSNNQRANRFGLKSRLKDKYNKNESLKEDIDRNSFKSDVYNALADVMFKYHLKGNDPTPEELSEALEWFELHFFEQGYDE